MCEVDLKTKVSRYMQARTEAQRTMRMGVNLRAWQLNKFLDEVGLRSNNDKSYGYALLELEKVLKGVSTKPNEG